MCFAVPPNPSAPQCISKTNTSLTFSIPTPCDPGLCEVDGYEVIFESLIDLFQFNSNKQVVANESSEILMTVGGLTAGVTYNITLTTTVENLSSAGSNSSNCSTGNYIEVDLTGNCKYSELNLTIKCIEINITGKIYWIRFTDKYFEVDLTGRPKYYQVNLAGKYI